MRKFFTRLLLLVTLFSVISLASTAQSWNSPTLTPSDGACTVAKTGTFTIDFGTAVAPIQGGKISLNAANGAQMYPIQFNWTGTNPPSVFTSSITPWGTVTFEGNKVIIDFKATLSEQTNYYITVHPNSIKNAANGNVFAGIGGTAPTSGALTCADEPGYGWDFTVGDFTPPTVTKLTPRDEAKNVSTSQVLGIKFNEPMTWAAGKKLAGLANGDIALYTSTDPLLGQYGGDVIFMKPSNVVFSGDSVNITWPSAMPTRTNVYVRIAAGLFAENHACECGTPKTWEGFNSNGQNALLGDNGAWNFTTKDNRAPVVSIAVVDCSQTSNFTITIDEPVVIANTMAALTNTNVDQFVTFSGAPGAFDATVVNNPGNTVITVNPNGNLTSMGSVTVGLTAGLWDASQNDVPATTKTFTNGDYTAPALTWSTTSPVGTSFDILAKSDEPADAYYVVVKKSDVLKAGAEFSKPTLIQIYNLAIEWDNLGNPALPAAGLYDDENHPLDFYFFNPSGTADDKNVNIWAAGKFPINTANTDVLERVADLPRTNGTEYLVYLFVADRSACGPYNSPTSGAVAPATNAGLLTWKSSVWSKPATTVDVLPPIPTITAALSTQFCDAPTNAVKAILKDGPIYITFNESIRLADGSPITPASLENVFEVWNDGVKVGINTLTSGYDAATKKVTLIPDSSFKSGSLVIVKLLSNKVEDMAGVERNVPVQENFCVETYCEPLLSYKANKYPTGNSLTLEEGDNEVKENATIQVIFDMLVYAPADNEVPAGALTPMVNDPTKINFVGNFIKIRESSTQGGAPTGNIVYANGNEANFDVTVNAYDGTKTIISITPAGGYEFGSEMWYNVEVEGTLQSAQRYTLMSGICHEQANNVSFQITDHEAPVAMFFEADAAAATIGRELNGCVNCDDPTLDVAKEARIGVKITEWIELGFDGMPRDLEPTETIADANALRRYFELKRCDGTLIPFDVEDFKVDATGDTAIMFIDPYNYPTVGKETPNFVAGESYTIKFISNPNEASEAGPYGPGAFADDHGNLVLPGEACFKIYQAPLPEPVCLDKIIIGAPGCEGVKADWNSFSVTFKFNKAMASVLKANPQYLIIYKEPVANPLADYVAYLPIRNMTTPDNGFSYVANASSIGWVMGAAAFTDNSTYYVAINDGLGTTDLGSFESLDQGCTWPNPSYGYNVANWGVNRVVVDTFQTGDFTAPLITSVTTGTIAKTANLVITYDEDVVPVAGQVVKIYENGTNTLIATVNVGGLNADGNNTVVLPNSTFNTFLEYGKTYYAQFNAGLVTDSCGNASTNAYLTKTDWVFTVEPDPAPAFTACTGTATGFSPKDEEFITSLTPSFVIKFSEPVVPVAGKKIDIYEELPSSAISIMGNFNVTSMTANADKTQYTIAFSGITSLATSLTYGNCYHLNIQAGAFQEVAGSQTTAAVVSFQTENSGPVTTCTWDFCVKDVIAPTVTFWPLNKYENVPLNAYLFAYISEPVKFNGTYAFTEVNAKNSFKLYKYVSHTGTDTTWTPIDFRLDAVGTDADKQRLMFTPLDPAAPDFGTTTNPTMDDDSWYKLEIVQPNTAGWFIEDAAGNDVVYNSVTFHTEDILCPIVDIPSGVAVTDVTASGFKFTVTSNEKDTIRYKVVGPGTATTVVASGWKVSNASGVTSFTVTGINALNAQSYKIVITATDDEIDRFDTSAEILAEWPYTVMPGLEEMRIKDIRKAPNTCEYTYSSVTLCDDDKPTITARVPAIAAPAVDPTANITFTLSEAVVVEMLGEVDGMNPDMIVLRDYENNLAVPAVITYNSTDKKVTINPVATLKDQHRYYVTWDRYAIRDNAMCGNTPVATYNYLNELIDKSWWFKTTDKTAPRILCDLLPNDDCTDKNEDLVVYVVDGNDVNPNTSVPYIDIYEVGSSIPHERVSTATATKEQVNDTTYKFTFHTVYVYLSDKCYTAQVPNNLFKDAYGNTSIVPECNPWSFCVQDYEAPIASYSVTMDYSYLYVATNDPQYERDVKNGDAGEVLTDVPTSSFFKAIFNESIEVLDTVGVDEWVPLNNLMDMDLLANALVVTNVTTGEELEYLTQYRIENTFFNQTQRFRIVIYDDTTHMGYSGFNQFDGGYNYALGSMMSNATYKIELKGGWISDYDDELCDTRNIMDDVVLLTATTRDDTPPTLTLKDANGAVICDPACPEALSLPILNNMGQPNGTFWTGIWPNYMPEWPGQNADIDELCNTCVAPEDHITLEFNKPVVKTPTEIINGQPMWWEDGGVDWWTEANLGLKKEDLMNTTSGKFIKFQKWNGSTWVNGPAITDVVITDNQKFDLYWDGKLMSEGIYAITFSPYSVKDQIRVPDGNEFLGLTCIFKVVDHIAPEIVKIHYKNDESSCVGQNTPYPTDVDTDVDLGIEFNERVWKGAAGTKLIIRRENGQQQQIIDASQLTRDITNKNLMWINNVDFEENTLYYVEIQEGFVTDTAHCGVNLFAGIDPEDSAPGWQAMIPDFEWVFETGDNTPPEPISLFPNATNEASKESDLIIIFDENVYTDCVCENDDTGIAKAAPMTWDGYNEGQGIYIYAHDGQPGSFGNIVEFIPFWTGLDVVNPRIKFTGTDIYNGLTSDKVVIDPITTFEKNLTYYVRVSDGFFCDGFMNTWDGIGDSTTWRFTITNDVAPEIASFTPTYESTVDAETNGYAITDLTMTFVDEEQKLPLNVKPGAGKIKIFEYIYNPATFSYEEKLWKVIDIKDPSVIFQGNLVTVKDVTLLDDINLQNCKGPRMYYVTVDPGAITNGFPGSLTYWEGFNDAFDWRFYTGPDNEFMMPYTIVKPVDTLLSIPAASTLEITFAENIEAIPATDKKVKIFNAEGDALVDEFIVVPANISGNKLTLVTDQLVDETEYYVIVEAGAIGDTSTCSTLFPGILDKTVWTFSTGDNTAPVPTLATVLSNCEEDSVTLTFTFDESKGVTPSTGKVNLMKGTEVFASASVVIGANMNTVTATFTNLPDTTVFTVAWEASVVKDNGNNMLANVAVADPAWTFKTADNSAPTIVAYGPVATDLESTVTISVKASEKVVPVAGKKLIVANGLPATVVDVTSMVTADGGLTYTTTLTGLKDTTTYSVTLEAGAFADLSCDPNAVAAVTSWTFRTDDNTAPVITGTTPMNADVLPSYIGMKVEFMFNEPVAKGTGNITIKRGADSEVIPVTGSKVVIDGKKVSLVLTDTKYFGVVNVAIDSAAFVDLAKKPNASDNYAWSFSIVDNIAPNCMTIISPVDGATNLKTNINLVMEFCERVAPGDTAKKLKIYEILEVQGGLPTNKLFMSTPITAAMINGSLVTVPVAGLRDLTSYIVMIDGDAIRDEAGNPYAGINDPITWNFTVGDNTAPLLVTWTPNNTVTADNHPVFEMTFNENVKAGDGSLYVFQPGVQGALVAVPITASMVNGNKVTVVYDALTHGALDKDVKYYVLVDNGAITDLNGNKFAGVADPTAWTFTTGSVFKTSTKDLSSVEFKVYPNPFNDHLNIQNNDKLTRVTITNIAGQRVLDIQYPERVIRTDNFVSGVYIVTLFTSDGVAKSERIVKR